MQMASGDSDLLLVEELRAELERLPPWRGAHEDQRNHWTQGDGWHSVECSDWGQGTDGTTTLTLQEELQGAKDATQAAQEELEMKRKASPERISTLEIKLMEQQRLNEWEWMQTLQEHQAMLEMVRSEWNRHMEWMEAWLEDVQKIHRLETAQLMEKISMFEKEHSTSVVPTWVTYPTPVSMSDPMVTASSKTAASLPVTYSTCTRTSCGTLPVTTWLSAAWTATACTLLPGAQPFLPSVSYLLPVLSGSALTSVGPVTSSTAARTTLPIKTSPSMPISSDTVPMFTPSSLHSTSSSALGVPLPHLSRSVPTATDPVVESMAWLLQAQVMTAQVKAAALQALPAPSSFTGEGIWCLWWWIWQVVRLVSRTSQVCWLGWGWPAVSPETPTRQDSPGYLQNAPWPWEEWNRGCYLNSTMEV